jgi:hypothetical protein
MRGVDVTDHLRGNYSCQLRSHKRWLKIFSFLLDQSVVNAYIVHGSELEDLGLRLPTHLAFRISLGKSLVEGALQERAAKKQAAFEPRLQRLAPIHSHWKLKLKKKCIECGFIQNWYCPACGYKWMCRQMCYHAVHACHRSEKRC